MEIQLKSQFYFCFVLFCLGFFFFSFFNRAFLHDHSQVTLVFRSLNKANKTINSIQFNLVYNSYFFSEQSFYRNYSTLDSHTNTVISHAFAYSSRWRRKPWQGLFNVFNENKILCVPFLLSRRGARGHGNFYAERSAGQKDCGFKYVRRRQILTKFLDIRKFFFSKKRLMGNLMTTFLVF